MERPATPENEKERLKALISYNVLDTQPEQVFDDITNIVVHICNAPIALICLIDKERQWFKSHHGLDVIETHRDLAYCAHAINNPKKILEVKDALKDQRFYDNPLSTGAPFIRYYAGAPLVTPEGYALGTLCVIDHKPRRLNAQQKNMLRSLSRQVMTQLELRKKMTLLTSSEKKYKELVENVGDIIAELDSKGKFVYVNPTLERVSGYSKEELLQKKYWDLVSSNTINSFKELYKKLFKGKEKESYHEFPFFSKEGNIVWIGQKASMVYREGRIEKIRIVARDITEVKKVREALKEREKLYRLITNNSRDVICLHSLDGYCIYVSPSVKDILGYEPDHLVGESFFNFFHPEDIKKVSDQFSPSGLASEDNKIHEFRIRKKDGKYLWVQTTSKSIKDKRGNISSFQTSTRDISKIKKTEEKIQHNEANLNALIEHTNEAIWSIDKNYRYTICNSVFKKIIKERNGTVPKKTRVINFDHLPNNDSIYWKNLYKRAFNGESFIEEASVDDHNQKSSRYEYRFNPIVNKKNEVIGVSVFMRDILEKFQERQKLERFEQGMRLINILSSDSKLSMNDLMKKALNVVSNFLDLPLGIISNICDNDYYIQHFYSNDDRFKLNRGQRFDLKDTYCTLTYSVNHIVAIDHMGMSGYKGHPCYENFGLESYIGAIIYVNDERYGTINFSSADHRIRNFDKYDREFVQLLANWVGREIERGLNEEALKNYKLEMEAFVKAAPISIAMFDRSLNYLAASEFWCKNYNLDGQKIIGENHYKLFPEVPQKWRDIFQRCLQGTIEKKEEDKCTRPDGSTEWLRWEIRPWYDVNDKIGGIIILIDDITERKMEKIELQIAKERAEIASKAKTDFLSIMSHEIRTPLNAIIGITHLLMQEEPRAEQIENLSLLKFSSENLLGLINDILDYSKIEAGKIIFEESDFNLKDLMISIKQSQEFKIKQKNLMFKLYFDSELPKVYRGDPIRIGQVINNLVSNAIKFTEAGRIKVTVEAVEITSENATLYFEVADTGIGIEKKKLREIFKKFTQAETSTTRKFGGTGLGLSITKKLLELMNSNIGVESKPGEGSKFYFNLTLPRGYEHSEIISKGRIVEFKDLSRYGIMILVVEDNKANQTVVSQFLKKWGIKTDIANNGEDALKRILSKKYDMVLMDLQMPVMSGYEASEEIRKMDDKYFKDIPIIALTASSMLSIQNRARSSGMNDFITKPFMPTDLYAKIVTQLNIVNTGSLEKKIESNQIGSIDYLTNGGSEVKKKLSKLYIERIEELKIKFGEAMLNNDKTSAEDIAHKVVATIEPLNLTDLVTQIAKGREMMYRNAPKYEIEAFNFKLAGMCDASISELKKYTI